MTTVANPQSANPQASGLAALNHAFRLPGVALAGCLVLLAVSAAIAATVGAVDLGTADVLRELLSRIPGVSIQSGLSDTQKVVLTQWRLPRIVLGGLVGASLACAGAGYQGVFRNPLADPFLLGIAAGAGLGASIALSSGLQIGWGPLDSVAMFAFIGALVAVSISTAVGRAASRGTASLLLAGVATASFLTAIQTFVLMRDQSSQRQIFSWLFGRLSTAGWDDVFLLGPYAVLCGGALFLHRRHLDVLRLGESEAISLGLKPSRVRIVVILASSLLTAAAVSVSGLIAFVGLVVPHVIRLAVGTSYRIVIPLSAILGAAFMILADVVGRTVVAPAELGIGVITAFVGAPFFAFILWRSKAELL